MNISYSTTTSGMDGFAYGLSSILAYVAGFALIGVVLLVLILAGLWKTYKKAGQPGWATIIPVYNYVVLLRIVRLSSWWALLLVFPIVLSFSDSQLIGTLSNLIAIASVFLGLIVSYRLAKAFGKGAGFTIGLIFLPFIFVPILGFGKSAYQPSAH